MLPITDQVRLMQIWILGEAPMKIPLKGDTSRTETAPKSYPLVYPEQGYDAGKEEFWPKKVMGNNGSFLSIYLEKRSSMTLLCLAMLLS